MSFIGVCSAVSLSLFLLAKLYFKAMYSLKLQNTNTSKAGMFLLWMAACGVIFLSVYLPNLALRQSMPEVDPKVSVVPLILGALLIGIFQKSEIKKLSSILDEKK